MWGNKDFISKYSPSIKFHNEELKFNRVVSESPTPVKIALFNKEDKLIKEFEPKEMTADQILKSILAIDLELGETKTDERVSAN